MPKRYGACGQNETKNRAAVAQFLYVTDDLSHQVAWFGQKDSSGIRLDIRPSLPQRPMRGTRLATRCDPDRIWHPSTVVYHQPT